MSDASRAAEEFRRLGEIMATLRGPDGCPWDREQTIDTLKPFAIEETYEAGTRRPRGAENAAER
jgi:tetrapyrrole methylase family protein/MazG family protein